MRATVALATAQPSVQTDEVSRLRAQLDRLQGRRLDAPVLPVAPALADLLPGGGLRPGAVYSLSRSTSLLLALMAEATRAGSWCGVVGVPQLGVEAAEAMGIDLSRLVLIPDPGSRWLAVTAAIADALPVVAVRPTGRAPDGEVSRLAARLRERGTVLLVQGPWVQAEAVLEVDRRHWAGLERGHGYLAEREVTLVSSSRRWPVPRRARVVLPDASGAASPVTPRRARLEVLAPVPETGEGEASSRSPLTAAMPTAGVPAALSRVG